jgi:hypothetical protein
LCKTLHPDVCVAQDSLLGAAIDGDAKQLWKNIRSCKKIVI